MGPFQARSDLILEEDSISSSSISPPSLSSLRRRRAFISRTSVAHSWTTNRTLNRFLLSFYVIIIKSKINLLLPFGPLAVLLHYLNNEQGWIFFFSLLGMIPLAEERLGFVTEQLAHYTGPTAGGLLNATFGNATELIVSINSLKRGLIRVIQHSLLGSILSSILLVLGCAFFTGGIVHYRKDQTFNKATATVNSALLLMSITGILFPTALCLMQSEVHFEESELTLSRFSSCIMVVAYAAYLVFQLKSHRSLYDAINQEGNENDEASGEENVPEISLWEGVFWLAFITLWVSLLSGYLVDTIEGASKSLNVSVAFVSAVLLPVVSNAAEYVSATMFALKDKLDIALGVAIGSATQISMFVIPFSVVVGWIMGEPMDLNFQLFETVIFTMTVLTLLFILQEGTANYFKGLLLILFYVVVAAGFFLHDNPVNINN